METAKKPNKPHADLQTAQNRMFPFIGEAFDGFKNLDTIETLSQDTEKRKALYKQVQAQVFDLLNMAPDQRNRWHMGIADSGKRTIEVLVNALCPPEAGKNALVDTENYVGFNKFSAAKALEKQKEVSFDTPFDITLGRALTVNSKGALDSLSQMFQANNHDTLWVAWNSTSTGIQEQMTDIVNRRNQANSDTLIIADAASLRLFSNDWSSRSTDTLPDVFFFSLRKQGLPYEGPNDEFHQAQNSGSLIIFNDKALERAQALEAAPLYDSPTIAALAQGRITQGEQRNNHIKHLLKLNCALEHFMGQDKENIAALDAHREDAQAKIMAAFAPSDNGAGPGFELFSDPQAQSDSAYILKVPEHTSAKKVITALKEKGVLISACMHPKMDGKQFVRFAFYPGNTPGEVDKLLKEIKHL